MIDWEKIFEIYGLTPDEFTKEVLTAACVAAIIEIDKNEGGDALRFTCSDDVSKIELVVRRL